MPTETPSQDCPECGRFVQDRPNRGLHCECGWSKPRGATTAAAARATQVRPLPDFLDPDELHRSTRERLFGHHPGPPIRLERGAYGLEPGDRITWRRQVWTVTDIGRWPQNNGHTLRLEADDGTVQGVTVPWTFHGWVRGDNGDERVEVLTSSHHPVCGDCGQPWPCRDVDEGFQAKRAVEQLLAEVEEETEYPWACTWCGRWKPRQRPRRFRTERGMKQHLRQCPWNPATWDTSRWLHRFDDDLRITGGQSPSAGGDVERLTAINRAVKNAALNGTLPERLDDLDIT